MESNRSEPFDWQPHLVGDLLEVRPLRPSDWDNLFAVASDALIWEQHPAHDRYKEEVFRQFFRDALESGGAFAVVDRNTAQTIGSSRYFGLEPENAEIEIGWTFLARSHWGGRYNAELKRLMLEHAFRFVASVVFLVDPTNLRSRKAVEKIGGVRIQGRTKTDPDGQILDLVTYEIRNPRSPLRDHESRGEPPHQRADGNRPYQEHDAGGHADHHRER
jgi:RimJ/RimL family protein N-acetyltransferase